MSKLPKIEIGSRLFLTEAPNLDPGTLITPGHYRDEVFRQALPDPNPDGILENVDLSSYLELVWEVVRLREYPHLPSRLDSRFLWADETMARQWHYLRHVRNRINQVEDSRSAGMGTKATEILPRYRQIHGDDGLTGLYEVEVVECQRACFADVNLISYTKHGDTIASVMERARSYWRGDGTDPKHSEVLLEGSVVIRASLFQSNVEDVDVVRDIETNRAIATSLRWTESWRQPQGGSHMLRGWLGAEPHLPMPVAGWPVVRLEGDSAPLLTPDVPVLVEPGGRIGVNYHLPHLETGAQCQPILFCDRSAAHYYQLNPYWEGEIEGEWQVIQESTHLGS